MGTTTYKGSCRRPQLCCYQSCDHPPDCDHQGYGTRTSEWEPVWHGSLILRWVEGAVWCNRCGWWLGVTDPPPKAVEWRNQQPDLT